MSENDFIRGVKHGKEQMRIESSNLRKELADKDARIKELEAERDRYKEASMCSRQRIASMLHTWELRDQEAFRSNAGDELRYVISSLDEALGDE